LLPYFKLLSSRSVRNYTTTKKIFFPKLNFKLYRYSNLFYIKLINCILLNAEEFSQISLNPLAVVCNSCSKAAGRKPSRNLYTFTRRLKNSYLQLPYSFRTSVCCSHRAVKSIQILLQEDLGKAVKFLNLMARSTVT
jgi:hypothetical protein